MRKYIISFGNVAIIFFIFCIRIFGQTSDSRNILNGYSVYENGYIDQPYVVILNNGNWLCVFTTGSGKESTPGQHIVSTVSADQGKSWSKPVSIEPSSGPSASWAIPYITSFGRVYVFYDYNGDNVNTMNGKPIKTDSELGWYCYKYSDNNGQTWSDRYRLPMPKAPVDFKNDFKGDVQMFWGIDKPKNFGNSMMFAFTRLGKYVQSDGEGWFYKSNNINNEKDAGKLNWQLLPKGDIGLRNPAYGSIQEEFNIVPLNNGDIYCMNRTTMGFPANSYSRDGGENWTMPIAATYTPGGEEILKNPRACPMLFKCSNGKYLFWFHNYSGKSFQGRNPVWISGGIEKDGFIHWSQPEILLYSNDLTVNGMSYPDWVEQNGKFWIFETQKTTARVHAIDTDLLEGMWNQANAKLLIKDGLVFKKSNKGKNKKYMLPVLPDLNEGGFSIDLWLSLNDVKAGQKLLDNRDSKGKGILITTTDKQSIKLQIGDGSITANLESDSGLLTKNKLHHVVFVVDGAPNIITAVIDGKLCDGGREKEYGWGRFSDKLMDVNSSEKLRLSSDFKGKIEEIRVYNRYLTTSECISNFHAGLEK